ncbi:MAG: hypothetical protein HWD59_11995 [Coxiellaceae bacterium]|nr:MAG: hypothetical protein HWD59_11995 [Coxiellaceae bacterium]
MATFIADYPVGQQEGRYLAGSLPTLPFTERDFELALCAYLLFANSRLSLAFHLAAIKEMCRVAEEVRIYPLIDEKGEPAATLAPVMLALQQENYGVAVKEVAYELQRGGNAMLCIWAQECIVPQK